MSYKVISLASFIWWVINYVSGIDNSTGPHGDDDDDDGDDDDDDDDDDDVDVTEKDE